MKSMRPDAAARVLVAQHLRIAQTSGRSVRVQSGRIAMIHAIQEIALARTLSWLSTECASET